MVVNPTFGYVLPNDGFQMILKYQQAGMYKGVHRRYHARQPITFWGHDREDRDTRGLWSQVLQAALREDC